jgi:hypothetical protein
MSLRRRSPRWRGSCGFRRTSSMRFVPVLEAPAMSLLMRGPPLPMRGAYLRVVGARITQGALAWLDRVLAILVFLIGARSADAGRRATQPARRVGVFADVAKCRDARPSRGGGRLLNPERFARLGAHVPTASFSTAARHQQALAKTSPTSPGRLPQTPPPRRDVRGLGAPGSGCSDGRKHAPAIIFLDGSMRSAPPRARLQPRRTDAEQLWSSSTAS